MTASGYCEFGRMIAEHQVVNHADGEYVRPGKITSNPGREHFLAVEASLDGTFHHVGKEHLHRYLAEFDYRSPRAASRTVIGWNA
jgi:hypothetical protein